MADLVINPANVVPDSAQTTAHVQPANTIAGEAIAAGETVCLNTTDNKYYRGDANDADRQNIVGIAGNSAAAAGQRVDIISQTPNLEVGAHGQAVATPLYQSATAGKLCPYADLGTGAVPVLIAFASSATGLQIVLAKSANPKP